MGVALYKEQGDPLEMNIVIDKIYLMSKGEPSEVGIDFNSTLGKRFIDDICEDGYEEHSRAIIHSHQNLGITPSSTDLQQIVQWAQSHPYYLSLIVNNRFEFNALLAIKTEKTITTVSKIQKLNRKYFKPTIVKETIVDYDIYYPTILIPKTVSVMAERIKSVQNYSSTPTYTTYSSKSINSNTKTSTYPINQHKKTGFGNYSKNNWEEEWDHYNSYDKDAAKPFNGWKAKDISNRGNSMPSIGTNSIVGKQTTLFSEKDKESDYPDTLVERVLISYCFAQSDRREQPYTPSECFDHIELDIMGYNIPKYILAEYIKRKGIFYNKAANDELYNLLLLTKIILP